MLCVSQTNVNTIVVVCNHGSDHRVDEVPAIRLEASLSKYLHRPKVTLL